MKESTIILDWKPLKSVGAISFGDPINLLVEKYDLTKLKKLKFEPETVGEETYRFPDYGTYIYVEDSVVETISCYDKFYYRGINLLGVNFAEIPNILGKKYIMGEAIQLADSDGTLYMEESMEYEDLGLRLGIKNGVVVSAMCHGLILE